LVSSEHVPQVNVQIHIVVVLTNTKCSKHIREVVKLVPAAHVLNPLSLGTRRSSHKGFNPLRKDTATPFNSRDYKARILKFQ